MKRLRILSQLWEPFTRGRPSLYAAGAGFYLLLSLLPAAVFLLGLLSRFPAALDAAMDLASSIIPGSFAPLVEALGQELSRRSDTALLSLSALTTLWSASKGVLAMMDGFQALLHQPDSRGFFRRRLTAIAHFLILSLSLSATFALLVLGGRLFRWLPGLAAALPLWVGFCLLYSVLPGIRLPFWCRVIGSGSAALGWLAFSSLFSLYVNHVSDLRSGLGFLVLALIWVQICMQLLLYGGILAKLLASKAWNPLIILRNTLFPPCS